MSTSVAVAGHSFHSELVEAQVNASQAEIYRVATEIYWRWRTEGKDEIFSYFKGNLGIPEDFARSFANAYSPSHPPQDISLQEAVTRDLASTIIFENLGLRLPSRHELNGVWPRNQLAWWVMRYILGSENFNFSIIGKTGEQFDNNIWFDRSFCDKTGHGLRFGFVTLAPEQMAGIPEHVFRKARELKNYLGEELGGDLAGLLILAEFVYPPERELQLLIKTIERVRAGRELIITGIFCPDYSYEETGDKSVPYRYTFDNLDDGVGLVTKQFVRVVPYLKRFFDKYGFKYRFVLSIADFEANSEEILKRVNISREEFHARCARSLVAFQKALPDIPMELRMFQQGWAGDRYRQYLASAFAEMRAGRFGDIYKNTGKNAMHEVNFIAQASKSFYCAWHNKEFTEKEIVDLVLEQAAEYAACGKIIAEEWPDQPVFQIAGDRPKMQSFGAMYCNAPILCTKRTY